MFNSLIGEGSKTNTLIVLINPDLKLDLILKGDTL